MWLDPLSHLTLSEIFSSPGDYLSLGDELSSSERFLVELRLNGSAHASPGSVYLKLHNSSNEEVNDGNAGDDLSTDFESSGTITITASDNSTLILTGIGDSTEPYFWTPSNSTAVSNFVTAIQALTDKSVTVEFSLTI